MTAVVARRGQSEPPPSRRTQKSPPTKGKRRLPFPVDNDPGKVVWGTPIRSMTPARYPLPQVWKIDSKDQSVLISPPTLVKESAPAMYQPQLKRGETLHSINRSPPSSPTPQKKIISSIVNVSVEGWRVPSAQLQNYSPAKEVPLQNTNSDSPSSARPLLQNTSPARVERCCSRGRKTTIPLFTDIGVHEAIRDLCPQFEDEGEGAISDLSSVEQVGSDASTISLPEEGTARGTQGTTSVSPAKSPQTHMFSEILRAQDNRKSGVTDKRYVSASTTSQEKKPPESNKIAIPPFKNETSEITFKQCDPDTSEAEEESSAEEPVMIELKMDSQPNAERTPERPRSEITKGRIPGISVTPMHSSEKIVYDEEDYLHATTPRIDGLDPKDELMPSISVTPTNSNLPFDMGTEILPAMRMLSPEMTLEPTTPTISSFEDINFTLEPTREEDVLEPTTPKVKTFVPPTLDLTLELGENDDLEPTTPTVASFQLEEGLEPTTPKVKTFVPPTLDLKLESGENNDLEPTTPTVASFQLEEGLEPTTPRIHGSAPPVALPSELDLEETYRTMGDHNQEHLEPTTPTIFGSISDIHNVDPTVFQVSDFPNCKVKTFDNYKSDVPVLVITSDSGVTCEKLDGPKDSTEKSQYPSMPHLEALRMCPAEPKDADVLGYLLSCIPKELIPPHLHRRRRFESLAELAKCANQCGDVLKFLNECTPSEQNAAEQVSSTTHMEHKWETFRALKTCSQTPERDCVISFLLTAASGEPPMTEVQKSWSTLFVLAQEAGITAENKKILQFFNSCIDEQPESTAHQSLRNESTGGSQKGHKLEVKPLTTCGMQLLKDSPGISVSQKQILDFLHLSQLETAKPVTHREEPAAVFAAVAATGLRKLFQKKSVKRERDMSV